MNLDQLSRNLGINSNAKRAFELLLSIKPSPVSDIAKELKLPKSTVYDAISELMSKSLLVEYNENNAKSYGIAPKDQIVKLHQDKIEELKLSQEFIFEKLNEVSRKTISQPKIKFYSGKDGMKHAFNDMPWVSTGDKESYLMWPIQKMIDAVGEEFLMHHGENRYKYKISIKVLRKDSDKKIVSEWLEQDIKERLTESRYLPKEIDWSISYWIYNDKCLFAGGDKEQFAFIIYSKEFADLMKTLWSGMWKISGE